MNELELSKRTTPKKTTQALEKELRSWISGEVRFEASDRALYSTDASNYRQIPIGVVVPKTIDDVVKIVKICKDFDVPIVSRGGGTSLAGQTCNSAVVIDYSKYLNKIYEINAEESYAIVEPGLILDELRKETKKVGLTFGPDPATHTHCTLGGMIGNNSCGVHAQMAGKTVDNIEALEVLTYDGLRMWVSSTSSEAYESIIRQGGRRAEIYKQLKRLVMANEDKIRARYPKIPRRVSGYNLDDLFEENGFNVARALVGTEGTCVVVLRAKLKLVKHPRCRALAVIGYPDIYSAGDHVCEIREFHPIGLEAFDNRLAEFMKQKGLNVEKLNLLPQGKGWLLVEFGGDTQEEADKKAKQLERKLSITPGAPHVKVYSDEKSQDDLWEIRESGLGATAKIPGRHDTWEGWEDAAVPPENVGDYLRDFRSLLEKYGFDSSLYGHFGQGCIHVRIGFDLITKKGVETYRKFVAEASDLVLEYGGSLSGEHGDGQSRGELLEKMYGKDLVEAFKEFKRIWDPSWKMNPGKVVDPYPITSNLRLGTDYSPLPAKTKFQFPEDDFSFAKATNRCVGVGKCRRVENGTMCPSYMVLREEKHSTRGRARLLFEMLEGDPIKTKWRSEGVKEALDLCLACKGCKSDCPVNVDMATYKAEFAFHYYKGRLRPAAAYAMGLIYWWSRLASFAPSVVNFISHFPGISKVLKEAAGIAPQREIPKFAPETFKEWYFKRRTHRAQSRRKVILWADTFNNNFHPEVAKAALEVLESAGFEVTVPKKSLCCGRPLYDFGFLNLAKRQLKQIMGELKKEIQAGTMIVGLEPSCVSVFKDELINFFPNSPDAQRLCQQVYMLSDFLDQYAPELKLGKLDGKAVLHGHCHQKSVLSMKAEETLIHKMGLECKTLDSGCCGMAGSFGFEKEKYDVSIACGERVLLPAVRNLSEDEVLVTNGFSCHQQITDQTNGRPRHIAELLKISIQKGQGKMYENQDRSLGE